MRVRAPAQAALVSSCLIGLPTGGLAQSGDQTSRLSGILSQAAETLDKGGAVGKAISLKGLMEEAADANRIAGEGKPLQAYASLGGSYAGAKVVEAVAESRFMGLRAARFCRGAVGRALLCLSGLASATYLAKERLAQVAMQTVAPLDGGSPTAPIAPTTPPVAGIKSIPGLWMSMDEGGGASPKLGWVASRDDPDFVIIWLTCGPKLNGVRVSIEADDYRPGVRGTVAVRRGNASLAVSGNVTEGPNGLILAGQVPLAQVTALLQQPGDVDVLPAKAPMRLGETTLQPAAESFITGCERAAKIAQAQQEPAPPPAVSTDSTILSALRAGDADATQRATRAAAPSWLPCEVFSGFAAKCNVGLSPLMNQFSNGLSFEYDTQERMGFLKAVLLDQQRSSHAELRRAVYSILSKINLTQQEIARCAGDFTFRVLNDFKEFRWQKRDMGMKISCYSGYVAYREYRVSVRVERDNSF